MVFDVEAADLLIRDLRKKFRDGKTSSYEWRIEQLKLISKLIDESELDIEDALRKDLCKPQTESFIHEIAMSKKSVELAINKLKKWMKPEKVSTSIVTFPSYAEIIPEPLGVVLIISPWNYPFLLSVDPIIGAIAAGNAVVLKPSEVSPATSSLLARLLPQYLDESVVKVIEGNVTETTALLEQKWDKILYTGNGRVGRIVMTAAAKHLTPVVLELGGKNPVVVDSNIDLKVAASRIVSGKWACNNGQTCIAPDYIITPRDFAPQLIEALKQILIKFYGKEPLNSMDLSHIVNLNHFQRLTKLLDDVNVADKIVLGGQRDEKHLQIAPTILLDVPRDSLVMKEEIFGPILTIITVDKVEDSFDLIIQEEKPLTAYLFTNNKELKEDFVRNISCGSICINDTNTQKTNLNLPFGGVGASGMGAYHGKFSFDTFSHNKGVLHRTLFGDVPVRYPPYKPAKTRLLRAILFGDIMGVVRSIVKWLTR